MSFPASSSDNPEFVPSEISTIFLGDGEELMKERIPGWARGCNLITKYPEHTVHLGHAGLGPADLLIPGEAQLKRRPLRPLGRHRPRVVRVALTFGHISDKDRVLGPLSSPNTLD